MSDGPNPDKMNPEDYRDAYDDARRDAFQNTVPRDGPGEQPRAIVLAGQPGAGKGRMTEQAKAEMDGQGGAVVIDPDKLREYHQRDGEPDYAAMAREDYRTAATRVHPDASQMSKDLRADAIAEKRNLIIDGTLNDPDKAEKLCRDLKAQGYDVEVRALAVNERVSQRGVAERLEKGIADPDAIPRDVPENIQSEAYRGMPDSVERIEHSGAADRVRVYRRGADEPVYSSGDTPPVAGQDAKGAIEAERAREMTPVEKVEHAKKWDEIDRMGRDRQAPDDELRRYDTARADAHVQLRGDAGASAEYDRTATREQRQHSSACHWRSKAPEPAAPQMETAASEKHEASLEHQK